MGYIKEPSGIDFTVDPTPLSKEDRAQISEVIAYYKMTGRKKRVQKESGSKTQKGKVVVSY